MAKFHDALSSVFSDGYDGDAVTDLTAAYDDDFGVHSAKIDELTVANEELTNSSTAAAEASEAEINRLKARNYDLMTAVNVGGADGQEQIIEDSQIADAGLTFDEGFFVDDDNA